VAQGEGPEFKPQYQKKKKKEEGERERWRRETDKQIDRNKVNCSSNSKECPITVQCYLVCLDLGWREGRSGQLRVLSWGVTWLNLHFRRLSLPPVGRVKK
jgi:hypothetical protein